MDLKPLSSAYYHHMERKDRHSLLWRMHVMASTLQSSSYGVAREALFKKLLHGSSPRNPTYILGRVISDFAAQGSTELTVRRGEEIFILFEINEWAFVTVFTNTGRRGYVPLDYCDVVKDFYELNPQFHPSAQSKKNHHRHTIDGNIANGNKVYETRRPSRKSRPSRDSPKQKALHIDISDQTLQHDNKIPDHITLPLHLDRITHSADDLDLEPIEHGLYDERTIPLTSRSTPSYETHHSTSHCEVRTRSACDNLGEVRGEMSACYCCCNHRVCRRREAGYHNVLHYLRQQPNELNSTADGSESGLGDSESINSASDMPILSPVAACGSLSNGMKTIPINNMSTQTSQSLEDLQKHLSSVSIPSSPSRPAHDRENRYSPFQGQNATQEAADQLTVMTNQSTSTSSPIPYNIPDNDVSSPRPSIDSLLSASIFERSLAETATAKLKSTSDNDSHSDGESDVSDTQYDTVKRRSNITSSTSGIVSSMDSSDELEEHNSSRQPSPTPLNEDSESDSDFKQPVAENVRRRVTFPSLPILEKGKQTNRVELSKLSDRIKEKLRPTRDELLSKRQSDTGRQSFKQSDMRKQPLKIGQEIPCLSDTALVPVLSATESDCTTSTSVTTNSNTQANGEQIKERKMTLKSIQEQYMRLEEARLLHNALKHLNEAIADE